MRAAVDSSTRPLERRADEDGRVGAARSGPARGSVCRRAAVPVVDRHGRRRPALRHEGAPLPFRAPPGRRRRSRSSGSGGFSGAADRPHAHVDQLELGPLRSRGRSRRGGRARVEGVGDRGQVAALDRRRGRDGDLVVLLHVAQVEVQLGCGAGRRDPSCELLVPFADIVSRPAAAGARGRDRGSGTRRSARSRAAGR